MSTPILVALVRSGLSGKGRSGTSASRWSATSAAGVAGAGVGRLAVVATPIQQGRTQQLWQVEIHRPEDQKLVARGQVRLQNIEAGA